MKAVDLWTFNYLRKVGNLQNGGLQSDGFIREKVFCEYLYRRWLKLFDVWKGCYMKFISPNYGLLQI